MSQHDKLVNVIKAAVAREANSIDFTGDVEAWIDIRILVNLEDIEFSVEEEFDVRLESDEPLRLVVEGSLTEYDLNDEITHEASRRLSNGEWSASDLLALAEDFELVDHDINDVTRVERV